MLYPFVLASIKKGRFFAEKNLRCFYLHRPCSNTKKRNSVTTADLWALRASIGHAMVQLGTASILNLREFGGAWIKSAMNKNFLVLFFKKGLLAFPFPLSAR